MLSRSLILVFVVIGLILSSCNNYIPQSSNIRFVRVFGHENTKNIVSKDIQQNEIHQQQINKLYGEQNTASIKENEINLAEFQRQSYIKEVFSDKDSCDIVTLAGGNEIEAEVIYFDKKKGLVYRDCNDSLKGKKFYKASSVIMIKYKDGSKIINHDDTPSIKNTSNNTANGDVKNNSDSNQTAQKQTTSEKLDNTSLFSFIAGLGSLFIFGIILGTAAVSMGIIALARKNTKEKKYKGKLLAIFGILLGVFSVVAVSIFLSKLK